MPAFFFAHNPRMMVLYGIPNCDTVKKARAWLTERGVDYRFHDFKKQGVPAQQLGLWAHAVGWETLLNRKGTSWRKLEAGAQAAVHDAASAQAVMLAHTSLIKRPVLDWGAQISVGFDGKSWAERLQKASTRPL